MSTQVNIHDVGIQINFPTWEKFNLAELTNDGVVLFQYLVFHCQHNPEWTHSDSDIEGELGIKRSRLNTIRKKFIDAGILTTKIKRNQYDNKITAYSINFLELSKIETLKVFYRDKTPKGEVINLSAISATFKDIAAKQPKPEGGKAGPRTRRHLSGQPSADPSAAAAFARQLEGIFAERRKDFNEARAGKRQAVGNVKFSPAHIRKLANAMRYFEETDYIRHAWQAYCDHINKVNMNEKSELLKESPRSPLNYFLSYSNKMGGEDENDVGMGTFAVIFAFGEYFASHYGRG